MTRLICRNKIRREDVRRDRLLNGLDYLEVSQDQQELTVYFLGKAPVELDKSNVRIEGGRRIRDIHITGITINQSDSMELDDYMVVTVDKTGDFSTYTLRVVEQNDQGQWQPHPAFDPRYDRISFSFKTDCPRDLDCKPELICPPEKKEEPEINYLARDYASFRNLILDRLALVMPDWKERHVPDIGTALVEVMAYVGDHLSYYQDAVATEAYLNTARRRISIRRHARLVDYPMHEGCNARTWVCVETDSDLKLDSKDTYFITGFDDTSEVGGGVLSHDDLPQDLPHRYEVFEPMGNQEIQIYHDNSTIYFYTWGDKECCLPRGATRATLAGRLFKDLAPEKPSCRADEETPVPGDMEASENSTSLENEGGDDSFPKLHLQEGNMLLFEEVISPKTGHLGDADPGHRHAVRLTSVAESIDPLNGQPVVEITWAGKDALPFPLCLSSLGPECKVLENVSVVRGNIILVDHGQTKEETLDKAPEKETIQCCKREGVPADIVAVAERYESSLKYAPLTFSQPLLPDAPASAMLIQDVRQALPPISLEEVPAPAGDATWTPRRDLLGSGRDDRHFVAEIDDHGYGHLRFGNDELGKRPESGMKLHAQYRVGNGPAGNVGAGVISYMVLRKGSLDGAAVRIRNPLPAQGGVAAEPMNEVRLFAPHRFRKDLQRAVIAQDYAGIVEREFKDRVQRAAAKLRWTGSWYEVLVAIDPFGQDEAGPELLLAIEKRLHRYRRMGHDLVVKSARRVSLDIEMQVCVLPNFLRGHIKADLLAMFSNRIVPDGSKGFFHPDKLTFGEGVYLSRLVAVAQAVEGVESVQITRLQRLNEPADQEIENGVLPLGPFEIARLDNDPSFPENGRLTLDMRGGR